MSRDVGVSRLMAALWLFPALLLSAIPLPNWLDPLRPDFLLLVIIGLGMQSPRTCGPGTAFIAGLALDAFRGVVLGQHAFAFVVVAWLVHRFHLRIRMFPPLQQAGTVFSVLFIYQFILFWIDGVAGHPVTDWARWLPVITGALLWPVLSGAIARHAVRG